MVLPVVHFISELIITKIRGSSVHAAGPIDRPVVGKIREQAVYRLREIKQARICNDAPRILR
jgi:hypothetical protein